MSDTRKRYSSSPCSLHEQDASMRTSAADVDAWRRKERNRLLGLRRKIDAESQRELDEAIGRRLEAALPDIDGQVIAVYWPIRGEPQLQEWYAKAAAKGALLALPVVIERAAPLEFRRWKPGDSLQADLLGIPAPAVGSALEPAIAVTPVVGFDANGYRLGNGGGYYDRTLASMTRRPLLVGVGYQQAAVRSIYPQPHDIPMQRVVTEVAVHEFPPPAGYSCSGSLASMEPGSGGPV